MTEVYRLVLQRRGPKAGAGFRFRLCRLDPAITGRGARHERSKKVLRCYGNLIHGLGEGVLVHFGRRVKPLTLRMTWTAAARISSGVAGA
jgi:hypothetical protein